MGSIYTSKTYSNNKSFSNKDYLHPVSREYVQKFINAGIRIPPNINEVDQFVKQLSQIIDPSLWVCWPLKSQHNSGAGTIVFSLGGLGNYTGAMNNGPTWSNEGITFDGVDDRILLNFPDRFGTTTSCVAVAKMTIKSTSNVIFGSRRTSPVGGRSFAGFWNTNITAALTWGNTVAQANASVAATLDTWFLYNGTSANEIGSGYADCNTNKNTGNAAMVNAPNSNTGNNFVIGNDGSGGGIFQGILSILFCFACSISKSQNDMIYDILKRNGFSELS